ncbi:MAG: hypothetical protein JW928_06490 [Candidatus Aureabacteria bacterium]|nr:hypothetical protein [Candidatus Auribacterota bacterium]
MKKLFLIFLMIFLAFFFCGGSSFALFTVPGDERVEEKEGSDYGKAYNEYAPDTLKLKSHEETEVFLNNENASCMPKTIPTPNLERDQHLPLKSSIIAASVKQDKKNISDMTAFLLLGAWCLIIVLLVTYVFIVKMRSIPSEDTKEI